MMDGDRVLWRFPEEARKRDLPIRLFPLLALHQLARVGCGDVQIILFARGEKLRGCGAGQGVQLGRVVDAAVEEGALILLFLARLPGRI